ncbi:MAG: outer membrane protein assembly factor BamA [Rhodobacteraceae bacterium]|nr:outer membrane protein assembly factor BamA [Paracoccaceae bacterium]MCY4251120.1 outer membrane protein assembly factor BamA [Paracoccaceae bacterium]MCY4308903.1 outer membrane protein assembly factor BamA [Paracoccaceae bacterium]
MQLRFRIFLIASSLFLGGVIGSVAYAQSYSYDRIDVVGNLRIDRDSIIRISELPESGTVSSSDLNEAFKNLSDRELFQNITIVPKNRLLEIAVEEYPLINEISIEGNRRIKDEVIEPFIRSQARQVYLPSRALVDAETISRLYFARGRFAATVTPKIIRRRDNRVDLVFEITEGKVVEVERLSFIGNQAFSDEKLRRELVTRQAGALRTFIQRDTFVADRLELDKTLLRDFYLDNGYVDFEIESATVELSRERDAFFINFKINEGQQHTFGELLASSEIEGVDAEEFLATIKIETGDVFSPNSLVSARERMEFLASEKEMTFARVVPRTRVNSDDNTVDVDFVIEIGPRVIVERIEIEGNVTTKDYVIRREFTTVEGDPLNAEEINRSAERVRALGFFSSVEVSEEKISPTQSVIRLQVEEQDTGTLTFGVGYSKAAGLSGSVGLTENNLLGRGQRLSLSIDTASSGTDYFITFGEPKLFGQDMSFNFTIGTRNQSRNNILSVEEFVLSSGINFPISESSRLGLNVGFSSYDYNLYNGTSRLLRKDVGKAGQGDDFGDPVPYKRQVRVGYNYSYNNIPLGFSTRQGIAGTFNQTLTFGSGSHNVLRTIGTIRGQTTAFDDNVTLTATLEGGLIKPLGGRDSRLFDRFQMNSTLFRGFAPYGVGPRSRQNSLLSLGGNYYTALRLESRFPLGFDEELGISGGTFFDVGSIWGLDDTNDGTAANTVLNVDDSFKLRSTAGVSFFIRTFLGPLRFNFSRPVKKHPGDVTQNFEVTLQSNY